VCAETILSASDLYRRCDPADIPFETTAEAPEGPEIIGQDRAVEAIRFGISIRREGYNLFALGPPGVGKQTSLGLLLRREAANAPTPADWCYVASLADHRRPRALTLPPGMGRRLHDDVERAVVELRRSMRAAFDSEEYRTRKQALVRLAKEREERAFGEVQERAAKNGVAVVRTDSGVVLAPIKDGSPLGPAEFEQLAEPEKNETKAAMEKVGTDLQAVFRQLHDWVHLHQQALKALDHETAEGVAATVFATLRAPYAPLPDVLDYLTGLQKDAVDSAGDFLQSGEGEGIEAALKQAFHRDQTDGRSFKRYQVNVMVDNGNDGGGAPVVHEDNPTYANLVGRIEHVSQFGALVTDFTLIRPGALHRASGGYLILDALRLLRNPFAWEGLKRALRTKVIRMEPLGEMLGLVPTASLEPEPIPLGDTKVVLLGERVLYYLLAQHDADFLELFKVMADFEESMDRRPEAHALYAGLVAGLARKEGLRPLDRGAVARVIEHAARLASDAEKLSVQMRPVVDLLREADHFASTAGRATTAASDVQEAVDTQIRRAGRVRDRVLEQIRRDTILVDTAGEVIGQVNGLSVFLLGENHFGHPTRITARARMGRGEVVDIEREVELGGPIHSKGVLILSGFLGSRYAPDAPLSLSASLVFEQSYGGVEGDSASLAELCALLSAIGGVPLRQSLAMTGSVNQHGQVQPIGGVNEKIEGFFDVCRERGLTGEPGVIIPASNVKNLMLRRDVVEAVEAGRFQVRSVEGVDDALALLSGLPAGARDAGGKFPEGSFNARVEARLLAFAEGNRRFQEGPGRGGERPGA